VIDLDEIERVTNAATEGPWYKNPYSDSILDHATPGLHRKVIVPSESFYGGEADAAFVAPARERVPQLIARVRELEYALACARNEITETATSNEQQQDAFVRLLSEKETRIRQLEALLRQTGSIQPLECYYQQPYCPWCGYDSRYGHAPDCPWLAAMGEG
jgi:hypothetical protein